MNILRRRWSDSLVVKSLCGATMRSGGQWKPMHSAESQWFIIKDPLEAFCQDAEWFCSRQWGRASRQILTGKANWRLEPIVAAKVSIQSKASVWSLQSSPGIPAAPGWEISSFAWAAPGLWKMHCVFGERYPFFAASTSKLLAGQIAEGSRAGWRRCTHMDFHRFSAFLLWMTFPFWIHEANLVDLARWKVLPGANSLCSFGDKLWQAPLWLCGQCGLLESCDLTYLTLLHQDPAPKLCWTHLRHSKTLASGTWGILALIRQQSTLCAFLFSGANNSCWASRSKTRRLGYAVNTMVWGFSCMAWWCMVFWEWLYNSCGFAMHHVRSHEIQTSFQPVTHWMSKLNSLGSPATFTELHHITGRCVPEPLPADVFQSLYRWKQWIQYKCPNRVPYNSCFLYANLYSVSENRFLRSREAVFEAIRQK